MTRLRIPATVFDQMSQDLQQPHPFAAERVGFLFVRPDEIVPHPAVLLTVAYEPVPDDGYTPDNSVGARICLAIRV